MVRVAANKRKLGAFYTPSNISDLLSNWSIRHADDRILEPSFGGCGFLKSAVDRLKALGNINPKSQIYGCDVDPNAFEHLSNTLGDQAELGHFIQGDFLNVASIESWRGQFDVVIGNPPYLPYQKIDPIVRDPALQHIKSIGLKLGQRSSLWAYFVALSIGNLADGGRIAWVLPGSFLQADYAHGVRRFLAARFEKIRAFSVQQRLFLEEGTDEETVILLGEGFTSQPRSIVPADISLSVCPDLSGLASSVNAWLAGELISTSDCSAAVTGQISPQARSVLDSLGASPYSETLGKYLSIRIGLVTGDNPFFLLTRDRARELGISEDKLRPVLSKFSYFDGLYFSRDDQNKLLEKGGRALLVNCANTGNEPALQAYIDRYPAEKIKSVGTYGKRPCWTSPEDGNIPPAFFPVMHHLGPRLILNHSGANCTNTLHRAFLKPLVSEDKCKLLSISLLSTFSQISAEIVGRKYGSGVLKHEPRDAERISVLMPSVFDPAHLTSVYSTIDLALRSGQSALARNLADEFILSALDIDKADWMNVLPAELTAIRKRRVPDRKAKNR